jgi:glutamate racemase
VSLDVRSLPIGVFDSGVGGLTVLKALRARLPGESYLYLGDTARLPYGTKSSQTVARYAQQAAQLLVDRGVKLLVIACNTASAVAVEHLRRHFFPLPLFGVVEPGAHAACSSSRSGRIVVIGTEGTVRGGAYERAIAGLNPDARVTARACPLFVGLAEEGWVDGEVAEAVARNYLAALFTGEHGHDCLVLGCTHFPVLRQVVTRIVGPGVSIVDSAETTASAVADALQRHDLTIRSVAPPSIRLLATDDTERFARVGATFLGTPIPADSVELVDLL